MQSTATRSSIAGHSSVQRQDHNSVVVRARRIVYTAAEGAKVLLTEDVFRVQREGRSRERLKVAAYVARGAHLDDRGRLKGYETMREELGVSHQTLAIALRVDHRTIASRRSDRIAAKRALFDAYMERGDYLDAKGKRKSNVRIGRELGIGGKDTVKDWIAQSYPHLLREYAPSAKRRAFRTLLDEGRHLREDGSRKSRVEIARELGASPSSVEQWFRVDAPHLVINTEYDEVTRIRFSAFVRQGYDRGLSYDDLGRVFDIDGKTARVWMSHHHPERFAERSVIRRVKRTTRVEQ